MDKDINTLVVPNKVRRTESMLTRWYEVTRTKLDTVLNPPLPLNLCERVLFFLSMTPQEEREAQYSVSHHPTSDGALDLLSSVLNDAAYPLHNKRVVDFGCGSGQQAYGLVDKYNCQVFGLDIDKDAISKAQSKQLTGGVSPEQLRFSTQANDVEVGGYDVVISHNSFEHFSQPAEILKSMQKMIHENGNIVITFGPPWYAPFGSHMKFFCKLPWVNLFFSEKAILKVRACFRDDGAETFDQVSNGLNKMSLSKFERIIREANMEIAYKQYQGVKGMHFLTKVPVLRELFTNHVTVILKNENRYDLERAVYESRHGIENR